MRNPQKNDTAKDIEERIARVEKAVKRWKQVENIIIDYFDGEILDYLLQSQKRHEIFDKIIWYMYD